MSKSYRILLFSSLYFAQGMLMSYFLTFNILYLGDAGYSPGEVGIFNSILILPFVLKIVLGMLSDAVNPFGLGHRKPYIALGIIGQMITMLIAPSIDVQTNLGGFALLAFVASISMALYDTCTDGLALDLTPENERGVIQGAMVGARAAGLLLMLVIGGYIAESFGWSWVFYAISIISILPFSLLLISGIKEKPEEMGRRDQFHWQAFKRFGSSSVLLVAILGLVYSIALDGVLTYMSDYLNVDVEIPINQIGLLVALSMVGRIVGAITNSWVTDRVGHKQSLNIAIALSSIACFGLALQASVVWVGIFGFVFGVAYGYYTSIYAAVAMDLSDPRIAASMFAIFMMFVNLGTAGGQFLGGQLTESFGFATMAAIFGVLNLLNVPIVINLFKRLSVSESTK